MEQINWKKRYLDAKLSGVLITAASMLVAYGFGLSKEFSNQERLKQETRIVRYDIDNDGNDDLVFLKDNKPYDYFLFRKNQYSRPKEEQGKRAQTLSEIEQALQNQQ